MKKMLQVAGGLFVMYLALALPFLANAQLGGNDDVLGDSGFMRTVYTVQYGAPKCFELNAERCYAPDAQGRMGMYERDSNGNLVRKRDHTNETHDNPIDSQCGTIGGAGSCIGGHTWIGPQFSTMTAWSLPMAGGGCAYTVWGCNPLAQPGQN